MNAVKGLGILFLFFLIPAGVAVAADGTLFLSPASGSYFVGQTFDEQLLVNTDGVTVNAAEAEMSFDPTAVEVENISTTGSIIGSWPQSPTFSNTTGSIKFTGWMTSDYNGDNGLLITITFKALRDTTSSVQLTAGAILASTGNESNIITSMQSATFFAQPQEFIPPAPPGATDNNSGTPAPAPAPAPTPQSSPEISDALSGGITQVQPQSETASSAPAQPALATPPPFFTEYQTTVTAGQPIIIKGTTEPSSTVYVWLQQNDNSPVRSSVSADAQGSFTYTSSAVQAGTYHVWAQSVNGGDQSLLSNTLVITAQQLGLAASVGAAVNIAGSTYGDLTLLLVGSLAAGYVYHQRKLKQRT